MQTAKELFDKYAASTSTTGRKTMNLKMFTRAVAEIISLPVEAEVMANEVVGGGRIDNKEFANKMINALKINWEPWKQARLIEMLKEYSESQREA